MYAYMCAVCSGEVELCNEDMFVHIATSVCVNVHVYACMRVCMGDGEEVCRACVFEALPVCV